MAMCAIFSLDAHIAIDSGEKVVDCLKGENAILSGTGFLRITSSTPLIDSSIELQGNQCGVIFERLLPSELKEKALPFISIDGKPFDETRDRIALYGNGSEIIPGALINPLIVYMEPDCKGKSMSCDIDVYYRGKEQSKKNNFLPQKLLDSFDNNIRSFRLKRGYAATFANNYDGTGFSRVFIAPDKDLTVNEIPEGLEFTSFIRVSRADRVGKRGMCGLEPTPLTRSSWYYSWGASDESQEDYEFIPMRHNKYWDGWDMIGSRLWTSNVLGYNEPDHTDQSDLSPDYAISEWNNFMNSGLRVGSPAPDAIEKDWLKRFLATADSLNYRVDFVATHMYWNSQDPANLTSKINSLCQKEYGGRPMWITEWNNGANWTHEYWPDQSGTRLDAEFNVLPDENGNETTVSRPHTKANSRVQAEWLGKCLEAFDTCRWLERHAFFNWVEDARSIVIDNKLTPAGKVFAEFCSSPAFVGIREHVHKWHIAPPFPSLTVGTQKSILKFYDHNGETGKNYIIERRVNNGKWEVFRTLELGIDYKEGKTINCRFDHDEIGRYDFRIKATSYKSEESIYSRIVTLNATQSGVETLTDNSIPEISVENGEILLSCDRPINIKIYDLSGRLVKNVVVERDVRISDLPRGIYILNHRKIIL